jgi:serine-aspartate repeat-containing protein C/D/E
VCAGESQPNANGDTDGNSHSDSDANGDGNSYAYTDSYTNCDGNGYAYADSYANGDSNSNAYTDSYANGDSDSYAYTDTYAYLDAYGPAETKPDSKATTSDTAASPVSGSGKLIVHSAAGVARPRLRVFVPQASSLA